MSLKFVSHSVLLLVQAIGMSWKLSAFAARQLYAQSISSWMAYLVRAGGLYARQFWAFGPYDQRSIVRGLNVRLYGDSGSCGRHLGYKTLCAIAMRPTMIATRTGTRSNDFYYHSQYSAGSHF